MQNIKFLSFAETLIAAANDRSTRSQAIKNITKLILALAGSALMCIAVAIFAKNPLGKFFGLALLITIIFGSSLAFFNGKALRQMQLTLKPFFDDKRFIFSF